MKINNNQKDTKLRTRHHLLQFPSPLEVIASPAMGGRQCTVWAVGEVAHLRKWGMRPEHNLFLSLHSLYEEEREVTANMGR